MLEVIYCGYITLRGQLPALDSKMYSWLKSKRGQSLESGQGSNYWAHTLCHHTIITFPGVNCSEAHSVKESLEAKLTDMVAEASVVVLSYLCVNEKAQKTKYNWL